MNLLILAALITITPKSLESFQLISKPKPAVALEAMTIQEPSPEATRFWKWVGYATMATCGGVVPSSVEYRKSRGWDAAINNTPVNYSIWFGSSVGMNSFSEWQRRSENSDLVASALRLGALATCSYTAEQNFRKGWERR